MLVPHRDDSVSLRHPSVEGETQNMLDLDHTPCCQTQWLDEGIGQWIEISPARRSIRPLNTARPSATPAPDTGHDPAG